MNASVELNSVLVQRLCNVCRVSQAVHSRGNVLKEYCHAARLFFFFFGKHDSINVARNLTAISVPLKYVKSYCAKL